MSIFGKALRSPFDVYTLWILEQQRQRALSTYITMYAQFRQLKASQPRRSMWFALGSCIHALGRKIRALPTRLALPCPLNQDTPFSVSPDFPS